MMDQGNSTGSPAPEIVTPASENAAPWLVALRSGKYPQTKGYLKDDEGFCCLGVLCDISGAGEWVPGEGSSNEKYRIGTRTNASVLPHPLRDKFGLTELFLSDVMNMNDTGKTFPEIADYIEQNL